MTRIKEDLGESNVKLKLTKKLKTEKKKEKAEFDHQPLIYEGHHINTLEELRDLVKIKTFEEAVHGIVRKTRVKENA